MICDSIGFYFIPCFTIGDAVTVKNCKHLLFLFLLKYVLFFCCFDRYAFSIVQCPEKSRRNSLTIRTKKRGWFYADWRNGYFLYIVYNSWTAPMPLRGRRSPVAPFLCLDVKTYGKEKYSVIHISYSFNIHCFNGK